MIFTLVSCQSIEKQNSNQSNKISYMHAKNAPENKLNTNVKERISEHYDKEYKLIGTYVEKYDPNGSLIEKSYQSEEWIDSTYLRTYEYKKLKLQKEIVEYSEAYEGGITTTYFYYYDEIGRLLREETESIYHQKERFNKKSVTYYQYNEHNFCIKVIYAKIDKYGDETVSLFETYKSNKKNQAIESKEYTLGKRILSGYYSDISVYFYNDNNKLIKKIGSDVFGDFTIVRYEYNLDGNLIERIVSDHERGMLNKTIFSYVK